MIPAGNNNGGRTNIPGGQFDGGNSNQNNERDYVDQQKMYSQVSVNKHSLDEPILTTVVKIKQK